MDHQDKPNTIKVRIKVSKTDPFREGVDVFLGRTEADLCPVTALLNYLCARGSSQGPLFVFADRNCYLVLDLLIGCEKVCEKVCGRPV